MKKKLIVVSAVNLVEGGTLTILRECLQYLSLVAQQEDYRVIAIVHNKELAFFDNIEYIERAWPKKSWLYRLWFEYITMKKISIDLEEVYLWFSLHDTSPNVISQKQAVYCHNPFPFYKWSWRELFFTPKIVFFALFSKFAYQINIHKNNYIVVQQQWISERFRSLFGLAEESLIIAKPDRPQTQNLPQRMVDDDKLRFIYAASPNSHKNFECLAAAVKILSNSIDFNFEVLITVKGTENAYAKWLQKKWGNMEQLIFSGFITRDTLFQHYSNADCLVFPSKAETWGLPISEFSAYKKPMLLANLPYAYETAEGSQFTAFFDPNNPNELAQQMRKLIQGDRSFLRSIPINQINPHVTTNWKDLFSILLK